MLNFDGAECARVNGYFGRASSSVPIWMDRLLCNGREPYLDACPFRGWGSSFHFCRSHRDDSSAVCRNGMCMRFYFLGRYLSVSDRSSIL